MRPLYLANETRNTSPARFAVPLTAVIAVVAAVVIASWPQAGEPLGETSSGEATAPAPYAASDYSVPSAESVFKDGKYEIAEPVATF